MRSPIRQTIALLAVNLTLFLLGLLVLELAFGDWLRSGQLNKLNLVRSRRVTYDVSGLYKGSRGPIAYTRDRYGLRGSFSTPAEIDILTVGGSTTDQRGIGDGETWQDVLQHRFQTAGCRIVIGNAGVDGQSTVGHIRDFDWWFPFVPNLRPRYVLFYVGINDLFLVSDLEEDRLVREGEPESLLAKMQARSAVYHLVRTVRGIVRAKAGALQHSAVRFDTIAWTTQPLRNSYQPVLAEKLAAYATRLDALVRRTRALGAEPIFVTQPTHYWRPANGRVEGVARTLHIDGMAVNGLDCARMLREFDLVTLAAGEKHGVICVDVAGNSSWDDRDFYDYIHMTPSGTQKLGDVLYAALKDRLR